MTPAASLLRAALHLALALGSFALAAGGVRSALPAPDDSDLDVKLERYAEVADRVDTVFIGSSVVHRQVDPVLFDAETARLGSPTTSFNLGARMMSTLEAGHALREVLARDRGALRRVFLECRHMGALTADGGDEPAGEDEEPGEDLGRDRAGVTVRKVSWHDGPATLAALRLVLESDRPKRRKLELLVLHVESFLMRFANVGWGKASLGPRWLAARRSARLRDVVLGPRGDGFASLDWALEQEKRDRVAAERHGAEPPPADLLERKLGFAVRHARFLGRVSQIGTERAPPATEGERRVFRDLVETARRAGLEVVFFTNADVINPRQDVANRGERLRALQREGIVPRLLDLGDPERFPELYDPELRFDWSHLDVHGARMYTRLLAELWLTGDGA